MAAWIAQIVAGFFDVTGEMAETAAGAVLSWLQSAVDAMATVAMAVVQLLPDAGDLNLTVPSGWLVGYAWLNEFLPLSEFVTWFGLVVGFSVAVVTWRLGVTIYHLIPKPGMGT